MIQSVLSCTVVPTTLRQNTIAVEIGQKILELEVSCKSDSNNVLISGIVPPREKVNVKAAQVKSF